MRPVGADQAKASDARWNAAGATRFTYARKDGKAGNMNRSAPTDCYDSFDAMPRWALLALAVGKRARK